MEGMSDSLGLLRAPKDEKDFLTQTQVEQYLTTLHPEECEALTSDGFVQCALHFFDSQVDAEGRLGDAAALASVVLETLFALLPCIHEYMAEELALPMAMSNVLRAYRRPSSGDGPIAISREECPGFVRFCVAYRVHCYFETSCVSKSAAASPAVVAPLAQTGRAEVIFVVSAPGAESGKICEQIAQTYGYAHVRAASLLHKQRKQRGSATGKLIDSCLREGRAVPGEVVVMLLQSAMSERRGTHSRYLLEGFSPQSFEKVKGWSSVMGAEMDVKFCLYFALSEPAMHARLLQRKGAGTSVPGWDVAAVAGAFQQNYAPALKKLEDAGLLRSVSAEGSPEDVWRSTRALFDALEAAH